MLDSRLAEAQWRSHVAEEKVRAMASTARAEAVEAHMVLRKAVAAHAAEVASEKKQKHQESMKAWAARTTAMVDAGVAAWIQKYEDELARE